jgi:hypothetical protein
MASLISGRRGSATDCTDLGRSDNPRRGSAVGQLDVGLLDVDQRGSAATRRLLTGTTTPIIVLFRLI